MRADRIELRHSLLLQLVDEWYRQGVRHAVICPGSRSTPLALALARHGGFRLHVLLDERSAAFFALGIGKATGMPALTLSTSGTAAANFLPAAVEARQAHVPLLLLTADRPRAARDSGAPQTIDQVRLYGSQSKWFVDLPEPAFEEEDPAFYRRLAARSVFEATRPPRGVVHLNAPFHEPLVPPSAEPPYLTAQATMFVETATPPGILDDLVLSQLATTLQPLPSDRLLLVAGEESPPDLLDLAEHLGAPLLADPLSGLRAAGTIDAYDLLLRHAELSAALRPSLVLLAGRTPTSKALQASLLAWQQAGSAFLHLRSGEPFAEPLHLPGAFLPAEALPALRRLLPRGMAEPYRALWRRLAKAAWSAIAQDFAEDPRLFEGRVFPELQEALPAGTPLFVGNSMPIRDLDSFGRAPLSLPIYGNRGASGIDGVLSTALGVTAGLGRPTVLVLGDISFFHDQNGLLAARQEQLPCTIILLQNDGGGIFSFLPQKTLPEFEQLFGTPHGLDFVHTAALFGLPCRTVSDWPAFRQALGEGLHSGRPNLIILPSRRSDNVRRHARIAEAAQQAALAALRSAGETV